MFLPIHRVRVPHNIQVLVFFNLTITDIVGNGLRNFFLYGSKNTDGSGEQFQRNEVMEPNQENLPFWKGTLKFVQAYGEMDISVIGCWEYKFLCFEFINGVGSYPDYNHTWSQKSC